MLMSLNGIDISGWQPDLVPGNMDGTDFIIVKATGGAGYKNSCFAGHADATLAAGKLLGCYHYARDRGYEGSAEAEADNFVSAFKPYIGKAIPFLDWEAHALGLGVSWAKAWLKRVYEKTGVVPGIYMSKSVCPAYDWSEVAKYCPLWCAQYPNYETTGYQSKPWTDSAGFGAWSGPSIFQYASTGRIAGYSGNLDLNIFYGSKADWKALCKVVKGGSGDLGKEKAVSINRANVAAQIMEHLVSCGEHGYSQPGRYGTSGYCSVATDSGVIKVKKGDRDCSSAVCEAWELALAGTPHEGEITRYHTTYDMKSMFLATGLFEVKPLSFDARPGDVYLNESQHTAMCIQNDGSADLLGEFSISETGGIDGEPGDQTGRESSVHGYYENWDFILHYNGLADGEGAGGSGGISGDVDELARRVIDSEFGNGDARLAALGSRYDEVQARVNEILDGGASGSGGGVDVDDLARRVIAGEFGNGEARKKALGSNYDAVQKRVNEMLGAGSGGSGSGSADIDSLARAVIRGDYGNGDERKRRLGSLYSSVQKRVDEMLS